MIKIASINSVAAIAFALATVASGPAAAQYYSGYGQGMMGPGMMGPGMMGYGMGPGMMMGQGMGPGMMGHGMMGHGAGPGMMGPGMMAHGMGTGMMMGPGMGMYGSMQPVMNLTANDVKVNFERWIAATGNPNIKVGNIAEKDANTITADIVTKENSLVQQFTVDRRTGFYRPAQ
ncbi:MAG: hypothetical protein R3D82_00450 [Xanthobacteraceae bacterium]